MQTRPVWRMRVGINSQFRFRRSQQTLKEFKLYTDYFGADNPLVRRQSSSLSPSSSPCLSSGNHSLKLFQETIEGLQNQWPSSWGSAQAQLGRVGRASTNTGRFRVCGSRCRQRTARLTKSRYQFCDADLVWESKRFKWYVTSSSPWRAGLFFRRGVIGGEMKFSMELAAYWRDFVIDLSSAHCFAQSCDHSLVSEQKIGHWNKNACSESKPAQRSRSKSTTSPKKGRLLRFRSNRWTAQQLQMAVRKSLETMFGMILNWLQPKFGATLTANEIRSLNSM